MSTVSIQQQMRALVDQFETGLIEQSEYRMLRRSLLDRAANGEFEAPEVSTLTRPRQPSAAPKRADPPSAPERPTVSASVDASVDESLQTLPKASPAGAAKWVAVVAMLGILGAAAWWFSSSNSDGASAPVAAEPQEVAPASGPMERLTTRFMQQDDWSLEAIRDFSLNWQDFSPEQRRQAESSIWYRRFVRDLRDRLRLAELASDNVANDSATAISTLASEMGIQVESRFAGRRDVSAVKAAAAADNRARIERQREALQAREEVEQSVQEQETTEADVSTLPIVAGDVTASSTPSQSTEQASGDVEQGVLTPSVDPSIQNPPAPLEPMPVDVPQRPNFVAADVNDQVDPSQSIEQSKSANQDLAETATEDVSTTTTAETMSLTDNSLADRRHTDKSRTDCHKTQLTTRLRFCRDSLSENIRGPKLALVRAGDFQMGGRGAAEQPIRAVTISQGFAMGATEVTVAEFERFCKSTGHRCPENPWGIDSLPVVDVNRDDAVAFARWLSDQSGGVYRLPSEAEWEYATRAGSTTEYPFGDTLQENQAHYSMLRRQSQPLPANSGQPASNRFGLKHSIGNVSEWVADSWRENFADADSSAVAYVDRNSTQGVVRGGSYADSASELRSAARVSRPVNARDRRTGFRVLRELD